MSEPQTERVEIASEWLDGSLMPLVPVERVRFTFDADTSDIPFSQGS